ncbi:putative pentafunctional AROM polypeptide [Aspergillus stella-maris]|uniref:putative pentafunctional AROM polypeptide n=1 Tax=Aspergillus stella-maris TaxID=1810926 RepID=UPI003CCE40C5
MNVASQTSNNYAQERIIIGLQSTNPLGHTGVQVGHYSRHFAPDATIVLIGFPRSGRKTLEIIACVGLRRRLVDFVVAFQEQFKLPPQEYISAYELGPYRTVEDQLTRHLISTCPRGCVIVGLGDVAGQQMQTFLTSFGEENPVIYIRRGRSSLEQLVPASEDKIERFYQVGNTFFESHPISNFSTWKNHGQLKDTERVFVRFLNRIFGRPASSMLSSDWAYPYNTFVLQLPAFWLDSSQDLELLDAGADAISLILDLDQQGGSNFQRGLARYIAILRMHFRGPILIDVNPADSQIAATDDKHKGATKVMATYRQSVPLGWESQLSELSALPQKAVDLGFHYLHITGESSHADDNLGCTALRPIIASTAKIPVAMYNTGKALTAYFILHRKLFTTVGQAVEGTLSPAMHNAAYASCGLPHTYDYMQTPSIARVQSLFDDEAHGGIATTFNHDAKDVNAVNTIVLDRQYRADGTYVTTSKGYNTDYIGLKNCIHKHLSPANAIRNGTTALIIGAGGMARAAIYGCYQLGVRRICIYNRTLKNAISLGNYYNNWAKGTQSTNSLVEVIPNLQAPWPAHLRLPTIVVACLPVKLVNSDELVNIRIPDDWLGSRTGGVFLETPLLGQMLQYRTKGWVVVGRLNLLIEQGIAQYELFTKRPAPVHVMRRTIQELAGQYGYLLQ